MGPERAGSEGTARIPFHRPFLVGTELDRVRRAVESLAIGEGGAFTRRCERLLEEITECPAVLLTTSCTHALEMAASLLDCGVGDEIIVPSFTFVSTASAFAARGARPVFADIRPDTLNLDETRLEEKLTPRTRAIVAVHYAGIGCEMEAILAIAGQRGIPVIEDNAHGLLGRYRGTMLGRFGTLAVQSFHETKNLTCGRGGALLVNDPSLLERARILRTKGTNRDQFMEGLVDKYTWVDLGSSYMPSDLLSAFLLCQLEARDRIQDLRRGVWERYARELASWAQDQGIALPVVPDGVEQPYHMFHILLPSAPERRRFLAHMRARGVDAAFHYVPLHSSPMGERLGARLEDCPVAEDVGARIARLPFFTGLEPDSQDRVIRIASEFRCG